MEVRYCRGGCGTDISHLRADAEWCSDACRKRVQRAGRTARGRTKKRKPTRYRVFAGPLTDLVLVGDVEARSPERAVAAAAPAFAAGEYLAIPVASLKARDARGRKVAA